MNFRLLIFYAIVGFCPQLVSGQNNTVTSGTSITTGNRKISYTIGQVFSRRSQSATRIIREGLQQPYTPSLYSHVLPTYFGTSGASVSALNRKLSYTIGQPFYAFKSGSGGKVRDGIQQPLLSPVMLNLHLFIEGFYQGGGVMAEILGGGICDSIRVELHDPMSPSSIIYSTATLLTIHGTAHVSLPPVLRGDFYYVVIRHRNAIETWSKFPIYMTASSTLNLKTN
jgi:hypothetical protein